LAQLKSAARAKEARAAAARAGDGAGSIATATRPPRRRRPATRPAKPDAAATAVTFGGADGGPQLLPSGPTSRAEGPAASMRKRARKGASPGNGGGPS